MYLNIMKYLTLILVIIAFVRCSEPSLSNEYRLELEQWKTQRLSSLKAPDGWTTLVGLQWIPEGENSLGSSKDAIIRFPDKCPENMGSIIRNGKNISLIPNPAIEIKLEEEIISDTVNIHLNQPPQLFQWKSVSFYLLQRLPKYGLRIKDSLAEARVSLTSLPYFPVSEEWVKKGTFESTASTDSVTIQDVVGTVYKQKIEGYAVFTHEGKKYKLLLTNGGEEEYFINFADLTNGDHTYGGGRFLYVPREDDNGHMILDFNKAYSPPCEFTAYATCPIPPKENQLEIMIEAGEQVLETH